MVEGRRRALGEGGGGDEEERSDKEGKSVKRRGEFEEAKAMPSLCLACLVDLHCLRQLANESVRYSAFPT